MVRVSDFESPTSRSQGARSTSELYPDMVSHAGAAPAPVRLRGGCSAVELLAQVGGPITTGPTLASRPCGLWFPTLRARGLHPGDGRGHLVAYSRSGRA